MTKTIKIMFNNRAWLAFVAWLIAIPMIIAKNGQNNGKKRILGLTMQVKSKVKKNKQRNINVNKLSFVFVVLSFWLFSMSFLSFFMSFP